MISITIAILSSLFMFDDLRLLTKVPRPVPCIRYFEVCWKAPILVWPFRLVSNHSVHLQIVSVDYELLSFIVLLSFILLRMNFNVTVFACFALFNSNCKTLHATGKSRSIARAAVVRSLIMEAGGREREREEGDGGEERG